MRTHVHVSACVQYVNDTKAHLTLATAAISHPLVAC